MNSHQKGLHLNLMHRNIEELVEDTDGTALCPFCCIDSVIGDSSGFPITGKFLQEMHKRYF